MSDTHHERGGHRTDERTVPDGGIEVAGGSATHRTVVDRTRSTPTSDVEEGRADRDQHLFAPAELPSWALSLPLVGALAVAIGAQGSVVLSGGGSAWAGTVLAAVGMLVVVSLALRSI